MEYTFKKENFEEILEKMNIFIQESRKAFENRGFAIIDYGSVTIYCDNVRIEDYDEEFLWIGVKRNKQEIAVICVSFDGKGVGDVKASIPKKIKDECTLISITNL